MSAGSHFTERLLQDLSHKRSKPEVTSKRSAYQVTRSSSVKLIVAPLLRSMWPAASWDREMTWFVVSVETIEPEVIDSVQSTP